MAPNIAKLFEQEKELLALSKEWAQKAAQYDRYAEIATNEMIKRKEDFDFTVGDYNHYMDVVRDDQELAYLARLRSCVFYRKYTKIRHKREMIVGNPRHRRRSK